MRRVGYSDYVEWQCDWCDSDNKTELAIMIKGEAVCGACHCKVETSAQILSIAGIDGYSVGVAA